MCIIVQPLILFMMFMVISLSPKSSRPSNVILGTEGIQVLDNSFLCQKSEVIKLPVCFVPNQIRIWWAFFVRRPTYFTSPTYYKWPTYGWNSGQFFMTTHPCYSGNNTRVIFLSAVPCYSHVNFLPKQILQFKKVVFQWCEILLWCY